jgi:hypothetical protein
MSLKKQKPYTDNDQIESGRALGAGAKHSESLELVPLICVGVASKCPSSSWMS